MPERKVAQLFHAAGNLGVCSVEITAVLLALHWIEQDPSTHFLLCTDSVDVLDSLASFWSTRLDILYKILQVYMRIHGEDSVFYLGTSSCWSEGK